MTIGVWVLGNQLWLDQAALASCQGKDSPVLLDLLQIKLPQLS